jgi:transcriptional regulator with XRE-family HTH domain
MPRKSNKPPRPVKHPHIAAALRDGLERKGIGVPDLSEHLGLGRAAPTAYAWIRGVAAPRPDVAKQVAKFLNIPETELMKRPGLTMNGEHTPAAREVVRETAPNKALSFIVLSDGNARLQVDLVGPIARISAVLLHLMKENLVSPHEISPDKEAA